MSLIADLTYVYKGVIPAKKEEAFQRICAFIQQHEPWMPPQQPGFGPWIEYRVGDKGPHVCDEVIVLYGGERSDRECSFIPSSATAEQWNKQDHIVAYCVKLEDNE